MVLRFDSPSSTSLTLLYAFQIPENPDELADEQMDELQEELTIDFDIGFAIKVGLQSMYGELQRIEHGEMQRIEQCTGKCRG